MWAVHGLCPGLRVRVEGFLTSIKADDIVLLLLFSHPFSHNSFLPFTTPLLTMSSASNAAASHNTSYPSLSGVPFIQVSFHL
jgi:hypothetical protein